MDWPKTIKVRGITMQIESWDEFEEIAERYGTDTHPVVISPETGHPKLPKGAHGAGHSRLDPHDRTLLRAFVENNSLPTEQIGQALNKRGKAIRTGLDEWGHKIGLSESNASAFEPCFRTGGRGYRLLAHFKEVAKLMLNEQG